MAEPGRGDGADLARFVRDAAWQDQFLDVLTREEAARRFRAHLRLAPLEAESVPLERALGRVLAEDVVAEVDAPGFDRSSVDGFAVRATDLEGAGPERPVLLRLNLEVLACGVEARREVEPGTATVIATGGMVPRGADAVVMVEHTELVEEGAAVEITRAAASGQFVAFAGSDIARGETVLRRGQVLTSREVAMAAAIGRAELPVVRRPRVAILSTGDELVPPGAPIRPGQVYDSNAAVLAAAVEEEGGIPVPLGISPDDEGELRRQLAEGLACDAVLLSGGTSKGAGDLSYRVVRELDGPGVVTHGVALKPGKPLCLAVTRGKPVVILPGFPTSAIVTFHEFVAPVIRAFAGRGEEAAEVVAARLAVRTASERGRTEFVLVSLVRGAEELAAYPLGKGSGAVTSFAHADGFVTVPAMVEAVEAGTAVEVRRVGRLTKPADLAVIGSHCVGLDQIVGRLREQGIATKLLNVGSTGGLAAARRGECDVAPVHLMDPVSGAYNRPFLTPGLELMPGYGRLQGVVFRSGDGRFEGETAEAAVAAAAADPRCAMVNRNAGSGTRVLIDRLLGARRPEGYRTQPKSHNAVAAAVAHGRADWGVAIETVARQYGLGFVPLQEEHYDFIVPATRLERAEVQAFREVLASAEVQSALAELGFRF